VQPELVTGGLHDLGLVKLSWSSHNTRLLGY
jgi:hypothetical protein